MASTSAETSHPVVFTTQTAYPLPSQKFMIPTSWKRYQLSQLVNKALSLPKPLPFDFLVRGEILRGTLAEWCAEKGIGEEETLEIEYFESVMPPQKMSTLPHEDWVSSVSCQLPGYLFTASYDGTIRTFDYSQKLLHSAAIHTAPTTSICLVPSSSSSKHFIASASHDLTARLTTLSLPSDSSKPVESQTVTSLHLHTAPLASISANASGSHLLTASWDGLIGVWDTSIPASDEVPADEPAERKKRRRGPRARLAGRVDARGRGDAGGPPEPARRAERRPGRVGVDEEGQVGGRPGQVWERAIVDEVVDPER
ncbi:hypothetical protein EVJ58_g7071 [Rhodofomes roseus]|uniref:NLE domain-containing protein n=1 Tax=Rhodofomes roseus TaxID=34475 RepID=A0A4Y9Y5I3_9APHY|nr:hypothetical protein EVJ58_g7071 [Rhodofomes roseus]